MGILNKANEPNNFKGEFNERNILVHALKYLNETSFDLTTGMFPNIKDDKQRRYIESILSESNFFHYKQAGYWKQFQLTSRTTKNLFQKNAETLVDEYMGNVSLSEKQLSMEDYKLAAFKALREDGNEIGDEVAWDKIAKQANIRTDLWDDVKNILIHQGYIRKTRSAQGAGDLVRANASVVAAIYDLEKKLPPVQINQNFNAGGDINQSGNIQAAAGNSTLKTEPTASNNPQKSIKKEIIIGIIITVLGGLLTWGIIELVKWVS
ncbi:MAG: hypothetical protein EPN92_03465 [Chitinophagaceae bacterium]|nr:MAG: hypothetical protein EPN92_03465 [Chitinophagaceae bacterium]